MGSWTPSGNVAVKELTILLVGPKRTGKSSTGNTLLGQGTVFDIRGGGNSTAASFVTAGHHMTVVDAQGWGSSEEFVPQEEKIELLRALKLCGAGGPHAVLLVIPLLDFTEPERRAVERRMEVFTSAVWRHTMVVFTFGDWLRGRGHSVQEHIQSGGPALHWLMDKCRYRYHVLDNKRAVIIQQERGHEKSGGRRTQKATWQKKNDKEAPRKYGGGEADGRKKEVQEQVRGLLSKVGDMLQENGGWHFSLHMYQRLEEEWSRREQQLRAQLQAETKVLKVGSGRKKYEPVETTINVDPKQQQRFEIQEEAGGPREEGNKCRERTINGHKEESEKIEPTRQRSQDGCDTSSDSGGETVEEGGVMIEGETRESTDMKSGVMAPCQRLAFSPVRRLA